MNMPSSFLLLSVGLPHFMRSTSKQKQLAKAVRAIDRSYLGLTLSDTNHANLLPKCPKCRKQLFRSSKRVTGKVEKMKVRSICYTCFSQSDSRVCEDNVDLLVANPNHRRFNSDEDKEEPPDSASETSEKSDGWFILPTFHVTSSVVHRHGGWLEGLNVLYYSRIPSPDNILCFLRLSLPIAVGG